MNRLERIVHGIYLLITLSLAVLSVSCSSGSADVAGTGSQAGNGVVVIASAHYSDSSRAAQVDVYVRSAEFLPPVENSSDEMRETITGSDGSLQLFLPRDSVMVIELVDNRGFAHVTYCSTGTVSDTLDLGTVALEKEAAFSGSIDRSTLPDSVPVFVQVYGMNKSIPVNPDGTFRVDHMPPGKFSFRIVPGDHRDPYVDREPIALGPDDSISVGDFDPFKNPDSDTLIVRALLDRNNLTTIPVSSVITTEYDGRIVELDLRSRSIDTLIPEIGKLPLKRLLLSDNSLAMLPRELEFINSLEELDLSGNPFKLIPYSVFNLRNLRVLNVDNTQLLELHKDIGKFRYLRELSAQNNELTALPEEIGMLKDLTSLDLSGNQLTSLPYQITFLDRVNALDLNSNRLTTLTYEVEAWITEKSGSEAWKATQR